jgi:hypothetical protein
LFNFSNRWAYTINLLHPTKLFTAVIDTLELFSSRGGGWACMEQVENTIFYCRILNNHEAPWIRTEYSKHVYCKLA